jgi:hypothetical protein
MQIIQYVRKKGKKVGVLVATKNPETNTITVGWSKCCKRDTFNREFGLKIAFGRAKNGSDVNLPRDMQEPMERFKQRLSRYYHKSI